MSKANWSVQWMDATVEKPTIVDSFKKAVSRAKCMHEGFRLGKKRNGMYHDCRTGITITQVPKGNHA